MEIVFKYIHIVAVSFWIGGISLFSFVQAPRLFKKLENKQAGDCVEVMFPGYYAMGYICAVLAITSIIYLKGFASLSLPILVVMFGLGLTGGLYLLPRVNSVKKDLRKNKSDDLKKRFLFLHKASILVNIIVWLGGMFVLYFIAMW